MKAAIYTQYGPPDIVVQITNVEKPVPKDDELLIKVRAASVNPLDSHLMKGGPYIIRVLLGLGKPKIKRPGVDVAGQVEAVGKNVTQFKSGDAVFGLCKGTFAEHVCAPQSVVVIKPDNVTFEQAAAVPVAALTALQGLRDKGKIRPGQKVLINGAAGGVGTLAVQIAKFFGAHVTAVCSTGNVDMVRSIGADQVIDYTREDFTKSGQHYDLIFDCYANHPCRHAGASCTPAGYTSGLVHQRPGGIGILTRLIQMLVFSRLTSQKLVTFLAKPSKDDLIILRELMVTGGNTGHRQALQAE